MCVHAKLLQSCPTLCDPMNCSPPGSSVHGMLQARILEWVAMPIYTHIQIYFIYSKSWLKKSKEFFHVDLVKEKVTVYVILVANTSLSLFFWILCKKCMDKFLHKLIP